MRQKSTNEIENTQNRPTRRYSMNSTWNSPTQRSSYSWSFSREMLEYGSRQFLRDTWSRQAVGDEIHPGGMIISSERDAFTAKVSKLFLLHTSLLHIHHQINTTNPHHQSPRNIHFQPPAKSKPHPQPSLKKKVFPYHQQR
ncbi:hypothetical protein ONS95_008342 [Cadophora gregata]|uniref:uncharacterized protein n=1 Tax=Cadophora gregata TaxID=51156 RepID=UPI0026DAF321|nr:uncharacterized protein ONS95_008342 [Cadophora gregata]KAK0126761.1 hypothetical protein ONS95_008342 [Cadophora gregata]